MAERSKMSILWWEQCYLMLYNMYKVA